METALRTFKRKDGAVATVYQDTDCEGPRDWDNIGTLKTWHNRYNWSDKDAPNIDAEDFAAWAKENRVIVSLPVFLYDHSGLSMSCGSFGDPWDS